MGLEKEKVDAIMAEYGEQTTKNLTTIDELTNQVTTLTTEKETLETNQKEAIKGVKLDYALKAAIDVSTVDKIKTNGATLVFNLHEMIRLLSEKPDALLMNGRTLSVLTMAAADMGYITHSEDEFGKSVTKFDGIRLVDMGEYYNGTKSVDVVEIGASTGETSIYVVKFGLNALHGVSPTGSKS